LENVVTNQWSQYIEKTTIDMPTLSDGKQDMWPHEMNRIHILRKFRQFIKPSRNKKELKKEIMEAQLE
jgi:hypothetical protein